MNVWPAIVNVPERAAPVFALTVNVTLPLADPDGLPMIDSHDAFDVAVHEQPAPDASVIVTVPEPPAALIDSLVGEMV